MRSTTMPARRSPIVRVPYDMEAAARKIRDAGLPAFLAARLGLGTIRHAPLLEPGQIVDGFRLEEPLHPGGMAEPVARHASGARRCR